MTLTPEQYKQQLRYTLFHQVGAIFSNTQRGPGFCAVCTAPAPAGICDQCKAQHHEFGSQLADQVLPLAYVRGWLAPRHQSHHYLRQYKHDQYPDLEARAHLQAMIFAATYSHAYCIALARGWWTALTFVPSATRPGPDHPVTDLARSVYEFPGVDVARVLLEPGPTIADTTRWPARDRFVLPGNYLAAVRGRHVLVVDDTWTSGRNAQSAALTLRAAGAAAVTILCVGRWLKATWPDHRALANSPVQPYDSMYCPVTGGACPPPAVT